MSNIIATFLIVTVFVLASCTDAQRKPPLVTTTAQLNQHMGERIVVRGTADNAKAGPMVVGDNIAVLIRDFSWWPEDIRTSEVEVEGVLEREVIEAPESEVIDGTWNLGLLRATRGPGVCWWLSKVEWSQIE